MTKLLQGIVRISSTGIWQAQIHSAGKTQYIGVWDKPHNAATRAYMLAKDQPQQFSKLEAAAKLKTAAKFEAAAKLEAAEANKPKKQSAKLKSLDCFQDYPCIKGVVEENQNRQNT